MFFFNLNVRLTVDYLRIFANDFTVTLLTIFSGSLSNIHISHSASTLNLEKVAILMSTMCLPCFEHVLRVDFFRYANACKNAWKCSRFFPKAHMYIRQSIAIFRLHLKGVGLKWHSASASDIPNCLCRSRK